MWLLRDMLKYEVSSYLFEAGSKLLISQMKDKMVSVMNGLLTIVIPSLAAKVIYC